MPLPAARLRAKCQKTRVEEDARRPGDEHHDHRPRDGRPEPGEDDSDQRELEQRLDDDARAVTPEPVRALQDATLEVRHCCRRERERQR